MSVDAASSRQNKRHAVHLGRVRLSSNIAELSCETYKFLYFVKSLQNNKKPKLLHQVGLRSLDNYCVIICQYSVRGYAGKSEYLIDHWKAVRQMA